ncbi:MAG: glycosyltransferase family 4 protein [Bacteroidota bacterium]
MKKLKILMAMPYSNQNGTERHVLLLSKGLLQLGHEVTVAAPPGPVEGLFREAGLGWLELPPIRLGSFLSVMRTLSEAAKTHDLCHFHAAMEFCPGLRLFNRKIPLVFTAHGYLNELDYLKSGLFLNGTCDATISISSSERDRLRRGGLSSKRNHLIFNGIDLAAFGKKESHSLRAELKHDGPLIGTVGMLMPTKRMEDFIEAVGLLRPEWPDLHAVIVGTGPLLPKLVAQIDRLGLRGKVHLLGLREDVPAILASLDLFAMPSEREGMSLACIEAMASGLPVVCTDIPAFSDLIEPEVTGLRVGRRRPDQLAEAIHRLLADSAFRRKLGANAREKSRAFSSERMVQQTLQLYESLIPG